MRELRRHLSVYLRRVKKGEGLEVNERGRPVAILAPIGTRASILDRLVAAGRATPATGDLLVLGLPPGRPSRRASRALVRLRDEGA